MKITQIEIEELVTSQGRSPECFVPQELNETQRVLKRALELLGPNGENWVRRCGDCDTTFCTLNALGVAGADHIHYPDHPAARALASAHGDFSRIAPWNDDPDRTFADVKALYEKAIALAATQPDAPAR